MQGVWGDSPGVYNVTEVDCDVANGVSLELLIYFDYYETISE